VGRARVEGALFRVYSFEFVTGRCMFTPRSPRTGGPCPSSSSRTRSTSSCRASAALGCTNTSGSTPPASPTWRASPSVVDTSVLGAGVYLARRKWRAGTQHKAQTAFATGERHVLDANAGVVIKAHQVSAADAGRTRLPKVAGRGVTTRRNGGARADRWARRYRVRTCRPCHRHRRPSHRGHPRPRPRLPRIRRRPRPRYPGRRRNRRPRTASQAGANVTASRSSVGDSSEIWKVKGRAVGELPNATAQVKSHGGRFTRDLPILLFAVRVRDAQRKHRYNSPCPPISPALAQR
jgi:hypothetical protein